MAICLINQSQANGKNAAGHYYWLTMPGESHNNLIIKVVFKRQIQNIAGLILSLRPADERRRYKVTTSLIGRA